MLTFIISVIKLLIIICVVATIHEFGHFLASKLLGVGINEFSIGMGKAIFQKKYKETTYSIRCLPIGGYVMIEGEGEHSDKPNSFENKSALAKITILAMGVIFNFILAIILFFVAAIFTDTYTTKITEIATTSPLYNTEFSIGDTITKINGVDVSIYQHIANDKFLKDDTTIVTYMHDGIEKEIVLTNAKKDIKIMGIELSYDKNTKIIIVENVQKKSAAEKAGIKKGDIILSADGNLFDNSIDLIEYIRNIEEKEATLKVKRDDEEIDLVVEPATTTIFDLGILDVEIVKTDFKYAMIKCENVLGNIFKSYTNIFKGKVTLDDVSSIVGVGVAVSKTKGLLDFIQMLALISIAIGIANILPILPLDGGKILFVIIETIIGKKVSENVELTITYIGIIGLILLTLVVTCKDIISIF